MENVNGESRLNNIIYFLLKLSTYIIIPLIAMMIWIVASSIIMCGSMTTSVDQMNGFMQTFVIFSTPMILFLAIIPVIIKVKYENKSLNELGLIYTNDKKNLIILAINIGILLIVAYRFIGQNTADPVSLISMITHICIIGITEEVMLRSIVYDEIRGKVNTVMTVIITALIFAFVYHSASDAQSNLLVRFPLGLILATLRAKTDNVYSSIVFHIWYNMMVISL